MWGAIGSAAAVDLLKGKPALQDIARDLHKFEARRFAVACYALGTTTRKEI